MILSNTFLIAAGAEQWRALFARVRVGSSGRKPLYHAYLQSRAWRVKCAAAQERSGGCCERCGNAEGSEVHHRTYANLGDEKPDDLACVCRKCHAKQHGARPEGFEDWMLPGQRADELQAGSAHKVKHLTGRAAG